MNIDLSIVHHVVEDKVRIRQFVSAAEDIDQNIGKDGLNGELTEVRRSEMGHVALAALDMGDVGALREIVSRFMTDLTADVLEKLQEHPELGDLLHQDFFENEPTREWTPPAELLAKSRRR